MSLNGNPTTKADGILTPPEQAPDPGPQPCLVIVYDPKNGFFGHNMNLRGCPIPGIVNHLEIVKAQLITAQLSQMRQKPGLVLPDGSPAGF